MFWVLNGGGDPRNDSAPHHVPGSGYHAHGAHRHREPLQESLEGSRYVVMFGDSATRFQRPSGARDRSASVILVVVKRFIADMRVPRAFKTENGAEYTNLTFVDYCNGLGIRRELTALIHAAAERPSGERTLEDDRGGARVTT